MHFNHYLTIAELCRDRDAPFAHLLFEAVFDRVLDEGLENHTRHDDVERIRADTLHHFQARTEPNNLDIEVFVDRFQLLAKRHEVIRAPHQTAEQS